MNQSKSYIWASKTVKLAFGSLNNKIQLTINAYKQKFINSDRIALQCCNFGHKPSDMQLVLSKAFDPDLKGENAASLTNFPNRERSPTDS